MEVAGAIILRPPCLCCGKKHMSNYVDTIENRDFFGVGGRKLRYKLEECK